MDLSLKVFNYNSSRKKILVCLDADCTVDKNYLTEIHQSFKQKNISTAYVNFNHPLKGNAEDNLAIICYEIFLRYYVLGLQLANSHFAFHTVGSTMVCDYLSYIKVEGMNKQKAAEDFYFMEKLAKNYKIEKIETTNIYPSARPSWRVPFGTGQRISRFLSNAQNEYLLYSPEAFIILKKWLEIFNNSSIKSSMEYLEEARDIHQSLYDFLIEQKFDSNWEKIRNNYKNSETLQKQKIFWFDGFKTLKLIHYLRDAAFPLVPMFTAIDELLKLYDSSKVIGWGDSKIPPIDIQKKYLEALRIVA
ncbi:MAG: hypothetical protein NTX22_08195 [Ignavibacteriales bacterium]|nr:hypothetical protein [Ignavibacteriales bacterium]